MSLEGFMHIVIEGDKGKEIYDEITSLSAKCRAEGEIVVLRDEKNYYKFVNRTGDEEQDDDILIVWHYTAQGNDCYMGWSCLDNIVYEENLLRIECDWRRSPTLLCYLESKGLKDYPGYYYHDSDEWNPGGETNDTEGKYFKLSYCPEEYIIPEGTTEINQFEFDCWDRLKRIVIPASLKEWDVFLGDVSEIEVNANHPVYDSRNGCNAIIETATNTLVQGCCNTVIPDSVTEIGSWAFHLCKNLTEIDVPESVRKIEARAFRDCKNLRKINLSKSVHIDYEAFLNCESLTDIMLPEGLTKIEDSTFYGCSKLKNVIIPNTVAEIGSYAFEGCESLTEIYIPDSVSVIREHAFKGCRNLMTINLPKTVDIHFGAFEGCPVYRILADRDSEDWKRLHIGLGDDIYQMQEDYIIPDEDTGSYKDIEDLELYYSELYSSTICANNTPDIDMDKSE